MPQPQPTLDPMWNGTNPEEVPSSAYAERAPYFAYAEARLLNTAPIENHWFCRMLARKARELAPGSRCRIASAQSSDLEEI